MNNLGKSTLWRIITAIITVVVLVLGLVFLFGTVWKQEKDDDLQIISTTFVGYDFARAVAQEVANVRMLLKPGSEMHNYEPTPQDIAEIINSDLFIYIGGESEEWVTDLLRDNDITPEKTLRLIDVVELKEEELTPGMEGDTEEEVAYDEHIWTSPANAIKMVDAIANKLSELEPAKKADFAKNAAEFNAEIRLLDQKIQDLVSNSARKTLVFGDRFPFRYFVDEYGLNYYAAFPGCSEQTEASSNTVAFLINKIKEEKIPVVLKNELTSDSLAQAIADETGAKVRELSAAHNISQADYDSGITYVDIWQKNYEILKEALN